MQASSGVEPTTERQASGVAAEGRRCRFCRAALSHLVVDLGCQPLANAYLAPEDLDRMEPFYPLRYHEHFSYFSFTTARDVFAAHGLTVFDVEQIPTHRGSLRIYARHAAGQSKPVEARVVSLLQEEERWGVRHLVRYHAFGEQVMATKRRLLEFLIRAKDAGRAIAAYGAPAKGITLLNYCGVRTDFIDYTVDRSPHKQGRYLPGSHIPIHAPQRISETQPDYLLIFPWNLKDEIIQRWASSEPGDVLSSCPLRRSG